MKGLELLLIIERPFLVHYFLSLIDNDTLDSIHQTIYCSFRVDPTRLIVRMDPIKIAWVGGFTSKLKKKIPNLSKLKQITFGLDVPNVICIL